MASRLFVDVGIYEAWLFIYKACTAGQTAGSKKSRQNVPIHVRSSPASIFSRLSRPFPPPHPSPSLAPYLPSPRVTQGAAGGCVYSGLPCRWPQLPARPPNPTSANSVISPRYLWRAGRHAAVGLGEDRSIDWFIKFVYDSECGFYKAVGTSKERAFSP